mmetsp:Transcript_39416/g.65518  ORF Transcript_39416/g.65518 Transcript_39416/m.65518 type:complete len:316 (+) Transcript_39416:1302-2249(+)
MPMRSSAFTPACLSAASTTWSMFSWCAACAASGFTPPHSPWISACDARTLLNTRPSPVNTAAAVSSQLVSIPSTRQSAGIPCSGGHDACSAPVLGGPMVLAEEGSSGGRSGMRPAASHTRTAVDQRLLAVARRRARLPCPPGPVPSSITSSRPGVSSLYRDLPRRFGHSMRQMPSRNAESKSTSSAIFPRCFSRYGSMWYTIGCVPVDAPCASSRLYVRQSRYVGEGTCRWGWPINSLMNPRAMQVLPAPRSPTRATTSPGCARRASSIPNCRVWSLLLSQTMTSSSCSPAVMYGQQCCVLSAPRSTGPSPGTGS